jgi:hypothetical protein
MSATLVIRHQVDEYAAWRELYDSLDYLRAQHGCTEDRVWRLNDNANDVLETHDFATADQAAGFARDPELVAGMQRGGVSGSARIEIFTDA